MGKAHMKLRNLVCMTQGERLCFCVSVFLPGQEKSEEPTVSISRSNCQRQSGLADKALSGGRCACRTGSICHPLAE